VKVGIFYEFTRNGRKETAEVSTEASSVSDAEATFKRKFSGRFDRVISTREIKRPPRV
jgi:hypothetical protein